MNQINLTQFNWAIVINVEHDAISNTDEHNNSNGMINTELPTYTLLLTLPLKKLTPLYFQLSLKLFQPLLQ